MSAFLNFVVPSAEVFGNALQKQGTLNELENNSANRKAALASLLHQYAPDYTEGSNALAEGVDPGLVFKMAGDFQQKQKEAQWQKDWDASGHVMNADLAMRAHQLGYLDGKEFGDVLTGALGSRQAAAKGMLVQLIAAERDPRRQAYFRSLLPVADSDPEQVLKMVGGVENKPTVEEAAALANARREPESEKIDLFNKELGALGGLTGPIGGPVSPGLVGPDSKFSIDPKDPSGGW